MEPRYYDAEGHINHDVLALHAARLRREAITEFWTELLRGVFAMFRKLRPAHASASTASANGLSRARHRSS